MFVGHIRCSSLQVEVSQAAVNGCSFIRKVIKFTIGKGFSIVLEHSFRVTSLEAPFCLCI